MKNVTMIRPKMKQKRKTVVGWHQRIYREHGDTACIHCLQGWGQFFVNEKKLPVYQWVAVYMQAMHFIKLYFY